MSLPPGHQGTVTEPGGAAVSGASSVSPDRQAMPPLAEAAPSQGVWEAASLLPVVLPLCSCLESVL